MKIKFQAISDDGHEFVNEKELPEIQLRHARFPWVPMKVMLDNMFQEFSETMIGFSETYRPPEGK
jgi:hypothetical protein